MSAHMRSSSFVTPMVDRDPSVEAEFVDNIVVCIALGLIGQAQVGARHVFKIRLDRGIFFGLRLREQKRRVH